FPVLFLVDCGTPTINSNSSLTLTSGTTTYLSVVTYTCDEGFFRTGGSVSRTCQDGGSWDGSAITCQIHDCNTPPSVSNSNSTYTLTTYQETVSYTCNRGYYRSSGDEELTCGSTGNWEGTQPTCTIHDCNSLSNIMNGSVDLSNGTQYLAVVSYACDTGYYINRDYVPRVCQDNGTWSGTEPNCTIY
ncbi:CSMD3-like protein, partial [Mya arenaria]